MTDGLRLFVWENVLCDYTSGIMFAYAHDIEEAKALIMATDSRKLVRDELKTGGYEVTKPEAFIIWGGS